MTFPKRLLSGAALALLCASAWAEQDALINGFDAAREYRYDDAAKAFGPLADGGNAHAQFNLGLMYHGGLGVKRDEGAAVRWYLKAAENGHKQAQEYLAIGYAEGWFGLEKDPAEARRWAAELGR